jgi:hypothetical protein
MILGPDTASAVKDDFDVVWLDNIAVKGKTVGLDIYTVGKTIQTQTRRIQERIHSWRLEESN